MADATMVFKSIIKRDNREEPFDSHKITDAICKSGKATEEFGEEIAKKLSFRVLLLAQQMVGDRTPTVEEIQDMVEEVLIGSPYHKSAKAYILYRDQRSKVREISAKANIDLVDQYLEKMDWRVNENSNMTFSLQGLNNFVSSEVSKVYWLRKIYAPEIRDAHTEGDFHIHDLNSLSVYCVGWDLMDILVTGFKGVSGKVESSPAKHLRAALGQIANFFYTLQGEAAGAQAFSSFDTLLAPFIRYDKLDYKEVKQALQEFIFNINVPTRVGFQTPFTNITMDLIPSPNYAKQSVVIGGKPQKETYGEFQPEMDMINRAFLEVMTRGDAKGRVFTFPIPTYNITPDFDWSNPNHDYLWKVTAKYGIPYFSNFVNSDMKPEDARSMCCRLRLDNRKLEMRGGGLFGANPLTGSIGVVTINLPRLGHLAHNENDFRSRLETLVELAKDSLEVKRKVLEQFTDKDFYPYTKYYLRGIKEQTKVYWKNHFGTVGIVGMNEACLNLIGKSIATKEGKKFAIRTMNAMRKMLKKFQDQTGNHYNLEATPAEGTSYRLAKLDKEKFHDIICANEEAYQKEAEPFYTNSAQLPVNYTDDVFEALDLQDDIQTNFTGGTVMHIFTGEKITDHESVKTLVKRVCGKYKLPYFSLTPTFSVCPSHGYLPGEQPSCPTCNSETEIYSRVVGYLRPVKQWNKGKKAEYAERKLYKVTA